jgi:hypothetical protein
MAGTEVSVPTLLEDFEPGDRIWFKTSAPGQKIFGEVKAVTEDWVFVITDDGSRVYVEERGLGNSLGNVYLHNLHKVLDVAGLRVGDIVSRKYFRLGSPEVSRVYAEVYKVVPDVSVAIRYLGNPVFPAEQTYEGTITEIEYQMVVWELEE